jgi:hypothetical protein
MAGYIHLVIVEGQFRLLAVALDQWITHHQEYLDDLLLGGDAGVSSDEVDDLVLAGLVFETVGQPSELSHLDVELFVHFEDHSLDGVLLPQAEKLNHHRLLAAPEMLHHLPLLVQSDIPRQGLPCFMSLDEHLQMVADLLTFLLNAPDEGFVVYCIETGLVP